MLNRIKVLINEKNRNILFELIRTKLKISDHHSLFGIFWSLMGPVVSVVILYMIFRERFGHQITAYPLYIFLGIVCVNFFMTTTTLLIKSFSHSREILLNCNLPGEDIFLSDVILYLYKFIIELILCMILSITLNLFPLNLAILFLPLLFAYVCLVLGVSFMLAIIYCFVRDVDHLWMIGCRLFYFITPIFYSMENISKFAQEMIYMFNPLTVFVISFRSIFLKSETFDVNAYLLCLIWGFSIFLLGYSLFLKLYYVIREKA